MIWEPLLACACPKCQSPGLERKEYVYPTLGYYDCELACRSCGLSLWPRADESLPQTYYRWLMDRLAF
ncbi:MAG: hypothetical protein GIX02_12630 [Candidatus Eremiobacteraeota bacterium]|nr:hypothetical protein [Candidatus Eremiobacteraeota bacterium]